MPTQSPRLLERFNVQWIEHDTWDPRALLQVKESIPHSLASCESLVSTRQYRPFLELQAMDTAIIDVPWNGFGQNVRIMEIDIDDVPWKHDLVTVAPTIKDGCILVPQGPGWGADINEEVLREHPWEPAGRRSGY